jgi:hypothetical protein
MDKFSEDGVGPMRFLQPYEFHHFPLQVAVELTKSSEHPRAG